ncbi:MAG: Hypothetical protein AJITA_00204 [Acetilactobacillus jinshanensis]
MICVWISGLIIITFLILGGIKLINQHQTAQTVTIATLVETYPNRIISNHTPATVIS